MRFPTLLALVSAVALSACGGGGSDVGGVIEDPQPSPAETIGLVNGDYWTSGIIGRIVDFRSVTGPAIVSTPSDMLFDWTANDGDSVSATPMAASFQMAADLSIEIDGTSLPAGAGGFSEDGDFGVFAGYDADRRPQLHVMLRRSPTSGDANAYVGAWHQVFLGNNRLFGPVGATFESFMGAGVVEIQEGSGNLNGSPANLPSQISAYELQGDKFVDDPVDQGLVGMISRDHNVIVAAGGTVADSGAVLRLYVRHSSAASVGVLQGSHYVTWMNYKDGRWWSHTGVATIDVNGNGRITGRYTNGVVSGTESVDFVSAVEPNGKLTISLLGADAMTLIGGVAADGRFSMGGGSTDVDPALIVLVRK